MAPVRFGLLRHGQTIWNVEKKIQGSSDSPLTDQGIADLRKWPPVLATFQWDTIVSSNQKRAQDTTRILNEPLNLPHSVNNGFREQDWGEWEGKVLKDLASLEYPLLKRQEKAGWGFCPPGGESRKDVAARALQALKQLSAAHSGENILIITHQSVIKCIIYTILGRSFLPTEKKVLDKNKLHIIKVEGDVLSIEQLNIGRE